MDSIISTFHIDWKIILAQAVNFAVVFVVLYIFALKPLSKLMTERSARIAKGIEDAEENAKMLKATCVEYEEVLAKARAEAHTIFLAGKKEAEEKKETMLHEAELKVKESIENGKITLEAEKVKMVNDAKKEIVALSMSIARKLVGEQINKSFTEKTIRELYDL